MTEVRRSWRWLLHVFGPIEADDRSTRPRVQVEAYYLANTEKKSDTCSSVPSAAGEAGHTVGCRRGFRPAMLAPRGRVVPG
jgi:hypothetical protein